MVIYCETTAAPPVIQWAITQQPFSSHHSVAESERRGHKYRALLCGGIESAFTIPRVARRHTHTHINLVRENSSMTTWGRWTED